MVKEFTETVEAIFSLVGSEENVVSVSRCKTRLRLNLKDKKKVDIGQFKKVEGVLGVVETKEQFQIIIKPESAKDLIKEFNEFYNMKKR